MWPECTHLVLLPQVAIMVPVHIHGNHWTLAVLKLTIKIVGGVIKSFTAAPLYDDSLCGGAADILDNLQHWLIDEFEDKKKLKSRPPASFTQPIINQGPHQENGWDCGVFACQTAHHRARELSRHPTFTNDDMPYFRRRMIAEIIQKALLTDRVVDRLSAGALDEAAFLRLCEAIVKERHPTTATYQALNANRTIVEGLSRRAFIEAAELLIQAAKTSMIHNEAAGCELLSYLLSSSPRLAAEATLSADLKTAVEEGRASHERANAAAAAANDAHSKALVLKADVTVMPGGGACLFHGLATSTFGRTSEKLAKCMRLALSTFLRSHVVEENAMSGLWTRCILLQNQEPSLPSTRTAHYKFVAAYLDEMETGESHLTVAQCGRDSHPGWGGDLELQVWVAWLETDVSNRSFGKRPKPVGLEVFSEAGVEVSGKTLHRPHAPNGPRWFQIIRRLPETPSPQEMPNHVAGYATIEFENASHFNILEPLGEFAKRAEWEAQTVMELDVELPPAASTSKEQAPAPDPVPASATSSLPAPAPANPSPNPNANPNVNPNPAQTSPMHSFRQLTDHKDGQHRLRRLRKLPDYPDTEQVATLAQALALTLALP